MKRLHLISKILIGVWAMLAMVLVQAGAPLLTFIPLTATSLTVAANGTATVKYQVTNQSRRSHTLVMTAIPGITPVTTAGNCAQSFVLGYEQSCILNLAINGHALGDNTEGGPIVCQQGSLNQCYQPNSANSLKIKKAANSTLALTATPSTNTKVGMAYSQTNVASGGTTPNVYSLSSGTLPAGTTFNSSTGTVSGTPTTVGAFSYTIEVTDAYGASASQTSSGAITVDPPTTLSVSPTATIPVNNGTSSFTVTNTGTNTAYNVHAVLPGSWTGVIQDSSNCASIPPNNGTCTLTFSSITPYIAQGNIAITGDNINSPPTTAIAFTTSGYLIWAVSGTTVQVIDATDLSPAPWAPAGYQTTTIGTTSGVFGTGPANTTNIVTRIGNIPSYAALACNQSTNGGAATGTWYLPAICELGNAWQFGCAPSANIYTNLFLLGFGGLVGVTGFYHSSTEKSFQYMWFESFNDNNQYYGGKAASLGVRCARAFTI